MEVAYPLSRFLVLATALAAAIGCQSDASGVNARGQMPQDPLAPIAPPPPPRIGAPTPIDPLSPIAPIPPLPPNNPQPGVVPTIPGGPIAGSPVPPDARQPVVPAGGLKQLPTAVEILKNSTPQVKVVAIVGANNVITDQEVRESVWQQNFLLTGLEGRKREEKIQELYTKALRRTIERELILDDMYSKLSKAKKTGIIDEIREESKQRADAQIKAIRKELHLTSDDDFNFWLRVQALTLPVLRRQYERDNMAQAYLSSMLKEKGRKVGLAEIRDYYDKHPEEFELPDKVKWQHIFISAAKHPAPKAAYEYTQALWKKAADGEDFTALSKQYDEGFAKMQNGFGTGELRDKIQPPDIEEAIWALKPGQISGILQTPTGWHIVKVVERNYSGVMPFDAKVQNKIRNKLNETITAAEMKKLVEELWRKGVVRVLDE